MNILLYVSLAWVALCVLFVGLDLIFLLMTERASDTSQAMMTDERISGRGYGEAANAPMWYMVHRCGA